MDFNVLSTARDFLGTKDSQIEKLTEMDKWRDGQREGETDRQTDKSNSKTLFYKDCSLGLVKNLTTSFC